MPLPLRALACVLLAAFAGGCTTVGASLGGATVAALPAGAAALRPSLAAEPSLHLSGRAEQSALTAEYQALQFGAVGQPVPWESDGYRGQVVPTQLYRVGSQECRGFTHTITGGRDTTRRVATACRADDDVWTPVV